MITENDNEKASWQIKDTNINEDKVQTQYACFAFYLWLFKEKRKITNGKIYKILGQEIQSKMNYKYFQVHYLWEKHESTILKKNCYY